MMKEQFGKHRQDFNEIRRLCLICHGLDKTSDTLFDNSTYNCKSDETQKVFHNLMSGSLLNLAIAIRTNIEQNEFKEKDFPKLSDCGSYYEDDELIYKDFNIKDVCDKIIHAKSVSKGMLHSEIMGDSKMTIQLKGEYKKKKWTLNLSVEHFTEAVLNFIDELEVNKL